MWDLHGTGLEPVSPALADGFLTSVPPGKALLLLLLPLLLLPLPLLLKNAYSSGSCLNP